MSHTVLCLNSGSSSLKAALYDVSPRSEKVRVRAAVEGIGTDRAWRWVRNSQGRLLRESREHVAGHAAATQILFDTFEELDLSSPTAAGHRIVHGGATHVAPERIDDTLLARLRELIPYAPLHLPSELDVIEAVQGRFPELPQVACFDTAFHRAMPELAQRFPLPRKFWTEGLRRYGFHGLSYEYILSELGERTGRVIIAHLGHGASMVAVRDGAPIDTTMGFTPTGGFMMGTRSGDLDPGVLVYLMREHGLSCDDVDRLINQESGLLGVSGLSGDMKLLLERRVDRPAAEEAIELFCYQIRKTIGGLAAALGGIDTLVFTGGIGERAAVVRWKACEGLEHLGIRLDARRNDAHETIISVPDSPCRCARWPRTKTGSSRDTCARWRSRSAQTPDLGARPMTSETTSSTKKTKNRICAISVAAPARPPNPNTPAINAMMRKVRAQDNIVILLSGVLVRRRRYGATTARRAALAVQP